MTNSPSLPDIFLLRNLVSNNYKQNILEVGDAYYLDASFTLNAIPPAVANGIWIMTKNSDKNNSTDPGSPGGTLSIDVAASPGAVNLSSEGLADWAHWGYTGATSFNHKAGVAQQISNFTPITSAPSRYTAGDVPSYSWTGGTPVASVGSTRAGLYFAGAGNGYTVTLPADTSTKTARVYLGGWRVNGKFEASLSDGSAPSVTTFIDSPAAINRVVTLTYSAASAGQQLTVKFSVNTDYGGGNVTLQAVTLNAAASNYLSFSIDRPATVYVAYDANASAIPTWLNSFSQTGLTVGTTNTETPSYRLYSKSFSAGSVVLGGNMAAGASGAQSNYFVIVVKN